MSILLENNLLAATEKKIESQLTTKNREDYLRIVVAGMKVGLAKGPEGILGSLRNSKNPIEDCVNGAIGLVIMLYKQSRGTMPMKAFAPAAMCLMLQALDFADKANIVKVGREELIKATHLFKDAMMKNFNVTPEMLKTAENKIKTMVEDPAKLEKIKIYSGEIPRPAKVPNAV